MRAQTSEAHAAGADLNDPDRDQGVAADSGAALEKFFNPVIRLMRSMPKPIVAAVNGPAAGVGMSFALAADIAIAARSATFLQAFARIGLLPDLEKRAPKRPLVPQLLLDTSGGFSPLIRLARL